MKHIRRFFTVLLPTSVTLGALFTVAIVILGQL